MPVLAFAIIACSDSTFAAAQTSEPVPQPSAETAPSAPTAPALAPAPEPGAIAPAAPQEAAPVTAPHEQAPAATAPTETNFGTEIGSAPVDAPVPTDHIAPAQLPHDLSPWNMFMSADIIVKAVMIGLAFASIVTWTVWLAKSIELAWAKRSLAKASRAMTAATSLSDAKQAVGDKRSVVQGLLAMATTELTLSSGIGDKAGIKERVASRLEGLTLAAGRNMNSGTGVLATIGSTAPFVGLFGTVWGIMNSFISISESQTTNLAVVAPGIAEALLATAIGLVAAIPAVIIYNQFARSISSYKASVSDAAAEVLRLVSRDLDRGSKIPLSQAAE
jgi:biopolymer transport protein ExbB